jgi:threonine/homoserine/homoserine lactone efflux protein
MIELILRGLGLGLLLCVLIGPVFFALIQNAIEKGFYSGFFMAIGIALSDAFYIAITYLGISQLTSSDKFNMWLGGIGGAILVGFGVFYLFKPVPKTGIAQRHSEGTKWFQQILKGFLLNGVNPFVLFFWIGIVSNVSIEYSTNEVIFLFSIVVATVFIVDILKSYFAVKLSRMITPRFMRIMNSLVGVALIIFSFRLFYFVYQGL